jgi:ribosomal RNA assembly protein
MRRLYIKSARKIMQNKAELEKKLKVTISVSGSNTTISGEETDEFFAERVLLALDFPFSIDEATLLLNEDYVFEILNIKDYTHRHDMEVIRGRIIGKDGKALRVIEQLSNALITVKDNKVALIARSDSIQTAVQAVLSIIRGSKHGNVYSYLEKSHKSD